MCLQKPQIIPTVDIYSRIRKCPHQTPWVSRRVHRCVATEEAQLTLCKAVSFDSVKEASLLLFTRKAADRRVSSVDQSIGTPHLRRRRNKASMINVSLFITIRKRSKWCRDPTTGRNRAATEHRAQRRVPRSRRCHAVPLWQFDFYSVVRPNTESGFPLFGVLHRIIGANYEGTMRGIR